MPTPASRASQFNTTNARRQSGTTAVATFTIASSASDSPNLRYAVVANGWPPATFTEYFDTEPNQVLHRISGGYYIKSQAMMRWDTSSLPDAATIISAQLKFWLINKTAGSDGKSLIAQWSDFGAGLAAADWVASVGTSALTAYALSGLTAGAYNTVNLTGVSGISKTGNTDMTVELSGGAPTADTLLDISQYGNANGKTAPQLIVTYEV